MSGAAGGVPPSQGPGSRGGWSERAVSLKHQSEQEGGLCAVRCVHASETEGGAQCVHQFSLHSVGIFKYGLQGKKGLYYDASRFVSAAAADSPTLYPLSSAVLRYPVASFLGLEINYNWSFLGADLSRF